MCVIIIKDADKQAACLWLPYYRPHAMNSNTDCKYQNRKGIL